MLRRNLAVSLALAALIALWLSAAFHTRAADAKKPAEDPAVARARREVKMLDDLYKTAVVYINDVYVKDASSHAAGSAARDLFDAMRKKKWHDARLIDATGEPINDDNKPKDKFERAAVEKLKAGEASYEEIAEKPAKSTFAWRRSSPPSTKNACSAIRTSK